MARKSLRPQLNQIRAWVRQGRTDAWIAHQLEVSTTQLKDFRSRHGLNEDGEAGSGEVDLRDEIEAEIEAAEAEEAESGDEDEEQEKKDDGEEKPRRRRRRRGGRGRRRRKRPGAGMEATLEHGGKNGYGLRLDDSIKDDPIYAEHWAERTELKVTMEPNRIVLEPAQAEEEADEKADEEKPEQSDKPEQDED
ncbi:MAG: hypothetical protein ACXWDP_04850 [Solirubrobacterales bacterium]